MTGSNTKGTLDQIRNYLPYLLLAAAGCVYYFSYYNYGINLVDEGFLLDGAERVILGQAPVADFFAGYMPGRYYFLAAFFKLFGQSIVVERVVAAVMHILFNLLFYHTAKRIMPSNMAFLATAVCLFIPGLWHKYFFKWTVITLVLVFVHYIHRRDVRALILAGLITGLVVYNRSDQVVFGVLTGVIIVFAVHILGFDKKENPRGVLTKVGIFAGASILPGIPLIVWYLVSDKFRVGVAVVAKLAAFGYRLVRTPYPKLTPLFSSGEQHRQVVYNIVEAVMFYLPIVCFGLLTILFVWGIAKKRGPEDTVIPLALLLLGVFSFNQVLSRYDLGRIFSLLPVNLLILMYLLSRAWKWFCSVWSFGAGRRLMEYASMLALTACLAGLVMFAIDFDRYPFGTIGIKTSASRLLPYERAGVYVTENEYLLITEVTDFIRANTDPGEGIFVVPMFAMFYFISERPNTTFISIMSIGLADDRNRPEQERIVSELEADKTRLVILNDFKMDGMEDRRFRKYNEYLTSYIESNYTRVKTIYGFEMFLREGVQAG